MARMNQQDLGLTGVEAYAGWTKPAIITGALIGVAELTKSDQTHGAGETPPGDLQKYLREGFLSFFKFFF